MDLQKIGTDPAAFRAAILIDSAEGQLAKLGDVLDDWQRDDFEALDPCWRRVAGLEGDDAPNRAWLERPRGHSKTADLAAMVAWVLAFTRRHIHGIAAAADKDQARLLRDAIGRLVQANPWLAQVIEVQRDRVVNVRTQSTLDILSSDAPTSYGLTPDFIVVDELTHWTARDLWDSLLSSAAKRVGCLLVVITNAGFHDSFQWSIREAIRADERWLFRRLEGPVASWIAPAALAEQRRLLPPVAYQRLWLNEWTNGSGDAIDPVDLEAAFTLPAALAGAEPGYGYVAGLDLGLARDASALVVVGKMLGWTERRIDGEPQPVSATFAELIGVGPLSPRHADVELIYHPPSRLMRVATVDVWRPTHGSRVDIESIENRILELWRQFGLGCVAYDPWQAEYLAERLRKRHVCCFPVVFAPGNLTSMATEVVGAFRDQRLKMFNDMRLRRDLSKLRIIEKGYGIKLDSPRGASGHGDSATALALALHGTKEFEAVMPRRVNRPLLCWPQTAEDCAGWQD